MKKLISILVIIVTITYSFKSIAQPPTSFEDYLKEEKKNEYWQLIHQITGTNLKLNSYKQLSFSYLKDFYYANAYSNMLSVAHPEKEIFGNQSFVNIITEKVEKNFKLSGKINETNLTNGLDNACKTGSLFSSLLKLTPITSVVSNVIGVVNNFMQQSKAGLFATRFTTANYGSKLENFKNELQPYINFYSSLGEIDNSLSLVIANSSSNVKIDSVKCFTAIADFENSKKLLFKTHNISSLDEYIRLNYSSFSFNSFLKFKNDTLVQLMLNSSKSLEENISKFFNHSIDLNESILICMSQYCDVLRKQQKINEDSNKPSTFLNESINKLNQSILNLKNVIASLKDIPSDTKDELKDFQDIQMNNMIFQINE